MTPRFNRLVRSFGMLLVGGLLIAGLPAQAADENTDGAKSKTAAPASPFVSRKVEGHFFDVLASVKDVIIGRGINIAHTLPASRMLNRTGPAYGRHDNVYMDAETVEFCSARISHMLAAANHRNILLCPFTISVYVLTAEPGYVYVSYRKPVAGAESKAAVQEVEKLMAGIVEEALSW